MILDPRSNTCPLAALWNNLGPLAKCPYYEDADIYNGLYNACIHKDNKKDGSCPNGYIKEKESSNELHKEMD